MVQQTDNHGWQRPEVNADENQWGNYLNNTIDDLDAEVILKDSSVNRPSAGVEDRWFLDTDELTLYYDNGNDWDAVAGHDLPDVDLRIQSVAADPGSASSPAYSFNTDSDTGMWATGNDVLLFGTQGTKAFHIDDAQHLYDADGNRVYNQNGDYVPQGQLENDTVTVAGNSVSLGGSTGISAHDLSDSGSVGMLDEDESVTGSWDFQNTVNFQDTVNLGTTADVSTTTDSTGATDEQTHTYNISDESGAASINWSRRATDNLAFVVSELGVADFLTLTDSGTLSVPNGEIYEQGVKVALTNRFPLPNSDLSNSTVSVAGNSVGLGGSTGVAYGDLSDTGTFPIPNGDLSNDSVTVAGNNVSLGNSTSVSAHDLSDSGSVGMLDEDETVSGSWSFDSGAEMYGMLDSTISSNNFWRLRDGSDGSNGNPFTLRYDNRDIRFYAGTNGVGTVWQLNLDGSVEYPQGPVTIDGSQVLDASDTPWTNSDISNSTVTVAGNQVSLGGSTGIAHGDLSDAPSDAHHNQNHDNADHTAEYVADGDGTTREIYVIANGASDPSGAGPDDLIFEEEA